MNKEYNEIINKFNIKTINFGEIDTVVMNDFSNDYRKLFYFFPMIERMLRLILDHLPNSDIENYSESTFNTLNSILEKNEKVISAILAPSDIDLLKDLFSDNGLRNKMLHYTPKINYNPKTILHTQRLFFVLICTYVINFIETEEG